MTERDIKQYYLGMMAGLRRAQFMTQLDNNGTVGMQVFLDGEQSSVENAIQKIREERDINLVVVQEELC